MQHFKRFMAVAAVAGSALLLAACSPPNQSSPQVVKAVNADEKLDVGFFGFAKSAGFSQGTFLGVQRAAEANNAEATFVDSNYNVQTQVQQIQDAVTSKQFDVIVVQANDNLALMAPLHQAVSAGITVVVEFSVIGPDFDKVESQVPGAISIVQLPTANGTVLGEMGKEACADVAGETCKVAYLEGFKSLPLDNARTDAVKAALVTDPRIKLVASVEGGYSPDSGRLAFQNVVQADPDVDVVIGASQAITGAAGVAGKTDIRFIGNGASKANVEAVRSGKWFSVFVTDVVANGAKATELGLAKARGQQVETAVDETTLAPNKGRGTKEALDAANFEAGYVD